MSGRVVVVGSLNVDVVATVERLPAEGETLLGRHLHTSLGGKGFNQAVTAARLGAEVVMVGCVGDDAEGEALVAALRAEDVDTSHVRIGGAASGRALITVNGAGANTIVVVPGANAEVVVPADAFDGAAVVLAQLECPLEAVGSALSHGRATGATTVLNPAPAQPLPPHWLDLIEVLVPNETEWAALGAGTTGYRLVVVTEGEAGALVHRPDRDSERVPAIPVDPDRVVDTTAAGDAFCGALAAGLATGFALPDALARAAAAGAHAVTIAGALPSLPTAADVDRLLG